MQSEPSKIVVTGIIVSAVAILGYVSQSGAPWSSTEELAPARSDEPVQRTLGNMVSGVVKAGPSVSHRDSGSTKAGAGQAASQQGPQPNVPVVSEAQLNVPNPDSQVHADSGQRATPAMRVEKKPPPRSVPLRTSASMVKHSRAHETRSAAHEPSTNRSNHVSHTNHANRATSNAQNQLALDKLVTRLNSNSAPVRRAPAAAAPAVASQSFASPPEWKAPQNTTGEPTATPLSPPIVSAPRAESTAPVSPPPAVQPAPSESAPAP